VPAVRDSFVVEEHRFLVRDFVEGSPLNALIAKRYPLTSPEPNEAAIANYTAWAINICSRVERAVGEVHDRGVVIGDLHPSNVLVRPDGQVVIIDWEAASPAQEA
jgi:serine/threonine protein kinase